MLQSYQSLERGDIVYSNEHSLITLSTGRLWGIYMLAWDHATVNCCQLQSQKWKCHNGDENFVTDCTNSCQNDNFQCSQWCKFHVIFITACTRSCQSGNFQCRQKWKFYHNEDISISLFFQSTKEMHSTPDLWSEIRGVTCKFNVCVSWWRHQMEIFSV